MSEPKSPEELLDEQQERWQRGERVFVETYLQQQPALRADRAIQLDLIYNEIVLREGIGEKPAQDEYLKRFPHLREDLLLQFELEGVLDWKLAGASGQTAPSPPPEPARSANLFPYFPGFEVNGIIGHGGTGIVYSARHTGRSTPMALKVLLAGSVELIRLRSEMETLKRLASPHIAQVHQISSHEGRVYAATELLQENLPTRIAAGPVPPRQAAQWVETLARTLQTAHNLGVIHGNLKPTNILFDRNGAPKITDFGLAKLSTQTIALLGAVSHVAPELLDGANRQATAATDVYGLGVILYELLTGRAPFHGPKLDTLVQVGSVDPTPPTRVQGGVPYDLETICLCCLHKDPGRRPVNAALVADDLAAFLANKPIKSRQPGLPAMIRHVFAGIWGTSNQMRRLLDEATKQRLRAERSAAQTKLLLELTRRLMGPADLHAMWPLLTEVVGWLADAEYVAVYFLDRKRSELWTKIADGELRVKLSEAGITGAVVTVKEPIHLADARTDTRISPEVERCLGGKRLGLLALPLLGSDGSVIGVAQVVNQREGKFTTDVVDLLTALLASAAISCEHALARHGR